MRLTEQAEAAIRTVLSDCGRTVEGRYEWTEAEGGRVVHFHAFWGQVSFWIDDTPGFEVISLTSRGRDRIFELASVATADKLLTAVCEATRVELEWEERRVPKVQRLLEALKSGEEKTDTTAKPGSKE